MKPVPDFIEHSVGEVRARFLEQIGRNGLNERLDRFDLGVEQCLGGNVFVLVETRIGDVGNVNGDVGQLGGYVVKPRVRNSLHHLCVATTGKQTGQHWRTHLAET